MLIKFYLSVVHISTACLLSNVFAKEGCSRYQHPLRDSLLHQCQELDFFSQWVIYISIIAIAEKKSLWHTYKLDDADDRLLFSKTDFQQPDRANNIFDELSSTSPTVAALARKMKNICGVRDFTQISFLNNVLNPLTSSVKTPEPIIIINPTTSQPSILTPVIWNPVITQPILNRTPPQWGNTIKAWSKQVSKKVSAAVALDWTEFSLHYEDCMDLYAPTATVANYVTGHRGWFYRCAYPMKVSAIGANGYDLLIGHYGAFNFEIEARIGLELLPPDKQGVYQIKSIPLPNYSSPGYQVDLQGTFQLKEVPVNHHTLEFEALPGGSMPQVPSVMTRWEWQMDVKVGIKFPNFIRAMPQRRIQSTGDRIILQIVKEVTRRLNNKVQTDFHTTLGIPFPKKIGFH